MAATRNKRYKGFRLARPAMFAKDSMLLDQKNLIGLGGLEVTPVMQCKIKDRVGFSGSCLWFGVQGCHPCSLQVTNLKPSGTKGLENAYIDGLGFRVSQAP